MSTPLTVRIDRAAHGQPVLFATGEIITNPVSMRVFLVRGLTELTQIRPAPASDPRSTDLQSPGAGQRQQS